MAHELFCLWQGRSLPPYRYGQTCACTVFVAALLLLFIFSVPPSALGARLASLDMAVSQQKQNAITLLRNGRHAEAYDMLMKLLRESPEDDDINMGIAVAASATQQYAQALMAYERLMAKYPRDARLRLEVARVYVALEELESAREELKKAREYDPAMTDEQVSSIMETLTAKVSRWQSTGRLTVGILYDTNSNQGPNSNFMTLGGYENLFVEGAKEKASWGSYASGSLEVGYHLGDTGPWWIMGDVAGYQRWNTSPGVKSNKQFSYGRSALGVRYLTDSLLIDLRMKGDTVNQTHDNSRDQNISSAGPELTLVTVVHPRVQLVSRATWEKRDYSVVHLRDGSYWTLAQFARIFFGQSNHEFLLGVGLTGCQPDVTAYKYLGTEPIARLALKLPYDLTFSPFVAFREERYEGPATGLETSKRRDRTWRSGASLTWDITQRFTLDFNVQHVDNDSNSSLYTYKQNVFSMGVTFKF